MSVHTVSFRNIDANGISFLSALTRGTDEGKVVKVSANGTVGLCSATDNFIGVVKTIDPSDKLAVVQSEGFVTLDYTGSAPSLGFVALEADGTGGVQIVATPALGDTYYWVVDVDTTNTKVTFCLG